MNEFRTEKLKASAERLWDATRKTLQTAGFRASQYKEIAEKKFDLNTLHKNIASLHADIGRIVDQCRQSGEADILDREDIRSVFRRLDSYKLAATEMEAELERIKARMPPDPAERETENR